MRAVASALPLLVGVAYFLGWFPVGGYGVDFGEHLVAAVLPAITLAFAPGAFYARLTRSELTEVMSTDYVRTARAKGLSAAAALIRHALPNALLPVVADLGMSVGSLLGGAVIVETVFGWPGLGKLAYDATIGLDVPVVVGCVVVGTIGVLLGNVLGDLACAWLDPRIRTT